jgi:hypothetical protein
MSRQIRQIVPATGWRAVAVTRHVRKPIDPEHDIVLMPLVCFALVDVSIDAARREGATDDDAATVGLDTRWWWRLVQR